MSPTRRHITGYAFGLAAGAIWGTTGPLSTALYAEGAALTGIGFWRILLGTLAFAAYGLGNRDLFRIRVLSGSICPPWESPICSLPSWVLPRWY